MKKKLKKSCAHILIFNFFNSEIMNLGHGTCYHDLRTEIETLK